MTLKKLDGASVSRAINTLDYVNAFVLLGFCFFSFAYVDITMGGFHSLGMLKGHILDWYDFNNKPTNDYLPSTYILMALAQYIPFTFFGYNPVGAITDHVILWLKAETLLFGIFSAIVIRKIIEEMGYSKSDAVKTALFWFTAPFMIFSLLIFSQLDVFTLFFMMLGILYLLRGDGLLFSLFFGISITFKYFPALAFIPLLLLFEKNPLKIARNFAIFILPAALEVFIYKDSAMFREVFFKASSSGSKLFAVKLGDLLHVYPFIWSTVTALAYWLDLKNKRDEFNYWVVYIPLLVFVPLFMLIDWYPQWLMIMTPFLAIAMLYQKRLLFFIQVEMAAYYFYLSYNAHYFPYEVDARMFMYGGAGAFHFVNLKERLMKSLFPLFTERTWNFTAVSVLLFALILFSFPFHYFIPGQKYDCKLKADGCSIDHLRIRLFCSVMLFSIPAILCLQRPTPVILLAGTTFFPLLQLALIMAQKYGMTTDRSPKPD